MPPKLDEAMWPRLVNLNPSSPNSLQQQIREALVAAILNGRIDRDTPLPSSRRLAGQLAVARNTVVIAYQHLADEGYLIARERSGYFVNPGIFSNRVASTDIDNAPTPPTSITTDWNMRLQVRPSLQRNITKPVDWQQYDFPFIYGQMDPRLFPVNDWRECYRRALTVQSLQSTARDQVDADDLLLVKQIQSRVLPRRGIWASTDEILLTIGSQHALYMLAALLVGPEQVVGVEDPGYPDARNILALKTDRIRSLPVDQGGLVIDAHLTGCDYVFTTPSHQSPTTVTMPIDRRQALLECAHEQDFVIIEDDYDIEINYTGTPTPALKSLDRRNRVLYIGSLSKILGPGLRIGYMVAPPEIVREARALRRLMVRHPPTNIQHATALFLSLGHYDSLIQRLTQVFKQRWETMHDALERHFPDSAATPTQGGTAFWVRGPEALDARALAGIAARHGVLFEPGDVNFFSRPQMNCFRLGFSSIPTEDIDPGIALLARLADGMTTT